jgi:hypothetical protein
VSSPHLRGANLSNEAESRKSVLPQPAGASSVPSPTAPSHPDPSNQPKLDSPSQPDRQPDEKYLDHLENLQRSKEEARFTDLLFVGLFTLLTLALVALAAAFFLYSQRFRS